MSPGGKTPETGPPIRGIPRVGIRPRKGVRRFEESAGMGGPPIRYTPRNQSAYHGLLILGYNLFFRWIFISCF